MATYDIATQTIDPSVLQAGDILNCSYTGSEKNITLPAGEYKVEVWGGQGGYRSSSSYGGMGGYSYGNLAINSPLKIYLNIGGAGNTGGVNGGYNGGGHRHTYAGGGGATHIATRTGLLYNLASYKDSVIIVAGGGGSDGASNKAGGAGGGTSGSMPSTTSYGTNYSKQGTQTGVAGGSSYLATSPYTGTSPTSASTTYSGFGFGGAGPYSNNGYGGAGGAGWYGGGGNMPDSSVDDDAGGAGGSGYVNTTYLTSASTSSQSSRTGNGYATITILALAGTEYDISSLPFILGTNQITVSATGAGYRESFQSMPIVVTTYKLTAPVIAIADNIISFSTIANATLYGVYIDGALFGTSAGVDTSGTTTIDISAMPGFDDLEEQAYSFTVKATNPASYLYFDSDASNAVTYTIVKKTICSDSTICGENTIIQGD